MVNIQINGKIQSPESRQGDDQTVYAVSGPVGVAVESVCEETIDAMMDAYYRQRDTAAGGKMRSKCRCGCS